MKNINYSTITSELLVFCFSREKILVYDFHKSAGNLLPLFIYTVDSLIINKTTYHVIINLTNIRENNLRVRLYNRKLLLVYVSCCVEGEKEIIRK